MLKTSAAIYDVMMLPFVKTSNYLLGPSVQQSIRLQKRLGISTTSKMIHP